MRGLVSVVMAEAGGKDSGGEDEEVGGMQGGARGREWTAMEDMLLVYWCCPVLGEESSEPDVRIGTTG